MHFITRLLVNAAALWVAIRYVPGISFEGNWPLLFGVALVFGVLNAVIRPVLFILTLPFLIVTLGLYGLYLLYTGLPVLMQATRDRTLGYTVVIVICTVAITVAIALASGLLLGVLLPPDFAVPESGTARV